MLSPQAERFKERKIAERVSVYATVGTIASISEEPTHKSSRRTYRFSLYQSAISMISDDQKNSRETLSILNLRPVLFVEKGYSKVEYTWPSGR